MWTAIAVIIAAVIGAAVTIGTTVSQNKQNKELTEQTNDANLQAVRETNAANVEQANIAYNRSLPMNQVRNLMSAGMSKAGALSALTGGGTYTAPIMQSAHAESPKLDFGGISAAMERLQGVPANVEQAQLIEDQRKALAVDTQNKINAENRAQQLHEFDMWQKTYGKNAAQMIDSLSSEIVSMSADKGISLENIDTTDKLIKAFNLGSNKTWRSMPAMARNQVLDGVRTQAAENRAQQSQNNANIAAKDAHKKAIDDLLNSEFSRSLTHAQISKLQAETEKTWQDVQAYDDATDARQKENAARAAQADFARVMAQFGIAEQELSSSSFWTKDKDGNYIPRGVGNTKSQIANAWRMAGAFFGADLLQDIVKGLVMFAK